MIYFSAKIQYERTGKPLAAADVILMGHILHDWELDDKKMLIRKAYDALPDKLNIISFLCGPFRRYR